MYNEFEDSPAYAKIQGPTLLKFITKQNIYLGREVSIADYSQDEEVIFISDSNKISRRHLNIFWDESKRGWYAKNLSKNHVYVNKALLKIGQDPVKLLPVTPIQIDECKFYFFRAREE